MYLDLVSPNRFGVTKYFLDTTKEFTYSLGYTTKGMQKAYSMEFDDHGIIMMSHYVDDENAGTHYYSPVKIAHYALAAYNDYALNGDEKNLQIFNLHIRFLKENYALFNDRDDLVVWLTPSTNPKYNIPINYKSAIVQGLIMSALVRAYLVNGDSQALDLANKSVNILDIPVEEGGLLAQSKWGPMFEEYPCLPYSHVINGFMFCLIGLYDLYLIDKNNSVKQKFDVGISSLIKTFDDWILPYWSKYDLWDISNDKKVNLATRHYHFLHVDQLDILSQMSGKDELDQLSRLLVKQLKSPISFIRVYFNKFEKLILKK